MKKASVFLLAMAFSAVIGISNLAAQQIQPITPVGAIKELSGLVDGFDAVPTLSTEARYSVGLFGSDVDDFISVNNWDPNIGTFFFLGGFPSDGDDVDVTEDITKLGSGANTRYGISAGFAKSFSTFYLGVYLGGDVIKAKGNRNDTDPKTSYAEAVWNTNLAVLFGTSGIGGLRLDLIMDDITDKTTRFDGKTVSPNGKETVGGGVTLALRWGNTIGSRDIDVHAAAGYKFPDYKLETFDSEGKKKTRSYSKSNWLLNGGFGWDLNDVSTLEADLSLAGELGAFKRGETSSSSSGAMGVLIEAGLANAFEPRPGFELAVRPGLSAGFHGDNRPVDFVGSFGLAAGVDAGVKVRLPGKFNKFSVISGIGINIFEWETTTNFADPRRSAWTVNGISWNEDTLTSGNSLGLGMVFAPINNLSIGFGLNALLDNIVTFDLVKMQAKAGQFLKSFPDFDFTLDLTASYKF